MHQLKLDVIEESFNEIWVGVQTTSLVLVSNIRLRLRSQGSVVVLLGLTTTPSKEQLKKFADLWNPKYVSHVYKVIVAVDLLAILYGFAPWPPGHRLMFSLRWVWTFSYPRCFL